jgi:alkylated DNA repair dioxygenase AlkB
LGAPRIADPPRGVPDMVRRQLATSAQSDLFAAGPRLPAGFAYRDELIAPDEERALVEGFAALPFQPFDFHGHLAKRRVVWFGWRYDYAGRTLAKSPAMPDVLRPLRERAAAFAAVAADELQQVLVTEYAPGAGIGWHRDKATFAEVVAVSFLAPCLLRFRRREAERWERASRGLAARSVYLLRGAARWEWEHSIPPLDQLRYSVTFRTFVAGDARRSGTAPR